MTATVRWLMAQRSLQLVLRGGAEGLDRILDHAVTSELVDAARWLVGNEVVLTTGLRLPADADGRIRYLTSLHEVGIAALGFGVGLGHAQMPTELIDTADRLGLPLFEIPLPIPFAAITRAVFDQLAAQRSARLVAAGRAQPSMTRAAISGGADAVVHELADAVSSRVVLLDAMYAEVTASRRVDGDAERLRALVTRDPASAGAVRVDDDLTLTVSRIGTGTRTYGYLGVLGPSLDDVSRMLIGHAVSLMVIEYDKPRVVRRDTDGLQADALAAAMDGIVGVTGLRLLHRAADPDGRVRAVVFVFADADAAHRGALTLVDELEHRWRAVFVHRDRSEVIALLRGDDPTPVAAALLRVLGMRAPVRGGIGAPVDLAADGRPLPGAIGESVAQARLAARSATAGRMVDLAGAQSLLEVEPVRSILADTHLHRLAPIVAHDRDHGTDLHRSLLAFLEANGNWGVAAAALGVHRHTLRSRIERVAALLGTDLDDARARAELLLMMLGAET
ncbi:PucR family transcriptional regulator [Gordonia sp. NB41Y]|uniref:PucR family transcriptional regulator n=1 Tax=Gordonia sp. NB41Y TaxID=875808 RepID=UPI00273C0A58|nr:PucR family transcriptional regulator [Gordonia sp. NB41Y]WLP92214.1 PucR family transcriptional regulator ligand-binding domain-containing protein [Gordonia sp. NB41Y]